LQSGIEFCKKSDARETERVARHMFNVVFEVAGKHVANTFSLLFHEMRYYTFVKLLLHVMLAKS